MMTPHRAYYRKPAPKHIPLILALAAGAWVFLGAEVYLFGVGALTLLEIIGGAA
jgi:hypothetical protein